MGGRRAPACGVVGGEQRLPPAAGAAGAGATGLQGKGASPPRKRAGGPAGRAAPAGGAGRDEEGGGFRGITKDNNGRQQCWIALVYASLE